MELSQAIHGRRSTRVFKPDRVAKPLLQDLIEAAVQAPSAVNQQPWDFTVIQDASLLDRISAAAKVHLLAAPPGQLPDRLRALLERPEFHIFYHAPALIVISANSGDWATEDASLAAQNMMLAAHERGLGTCWIGFSQHWLATPEGRRAIGVPDNLRPVAPIIVGYPAAPMPPVPRNPPRIRWIG